MSHHITTFNANGKAIFSSKLPTEQNIKIIPLGKMSLVYTTQSFPLNLGTETDIDNYLTDRTNGLPPAQPCPPGGTSAAMIELAPGASTPNRRTVTMGIFGIMQGVVRLFLDSGEERVLKAGDVVVIRAALHTWKNETPDEGSAKLMVFAQSVEPFEVNGEKIEAVWA